MPFIVELGTLIVVWLAGWSLSFWLIRRGKSYIENYLLMSTVFLSFSALLVALFRRRLEPLASDVTALSFVVLLVAVVVTLGMYTLCPRYLRKPDGLIARHPEEFYLRMDYRYLVSKSFEVLFQQLIIVALTLLLVASGLSVAGVALAFLGIFGVLHLPMLRVIGRGPGISYTVASITLAIVFPLLILRVHSGYVYSYAVHWFAYVLAGALAWLYQGRAPQTPRGAPGLSS